jgi:hypothetical protein
MKSPEYGLMLRRWLTSTMFLLLCCVTSSILAFYHAGEFSSDLGYRLIKLSSGFVVFLSSAHHLVWWHLADLFDRGRQTGGRYAWLGSYGAFLFAYAARTGVVAMMASGVWDQDIACRGVFFVLTQSGIGPPTGLRLPMSLLSLAAYIFCLTKTVAAIRSRRAS